MIPTYRNILFNRYKDMSLSRLPPKISIYKIVFRFCNKVCLVFLLIFCMKLSLIIFCRKFSVVLFAYSIEEDVLKCPPSSCTQALRHWHDTLIHSRGFDAWSFTLFWSSLILE